jgi:hypothetical protein
LIRFDLDSGAVVPRPDVIPSGDFQFDAPLWTTPFDGPETRCATGGCSLFSGSLQAAARPTDNLLAHPDGHVYATGFADIWDGVPGMGTFVETRPALVRYDDAGLDAPSVVAVLPADLLEGDPQAPTFSAALTLRSNQSIQIATTMGAYGVDVATFGSATVPANLLASPDPALTAGLDLSPFDGFLGEAFADLAGNIYLPETDSSAGGDGDARLHKFAASSGEYLGVVFEEFLPGGIVAPEYSFNSGAYVGVPEPSAVLLSLMAIAGVAARRRA